MDSWRIFKANARSIPLPDQSVQCVVTSPPYWGLRDYRLEPTVWGGDATCEHDFTLETVEREMRRGVNLAESDVSTRGGGKKIAEVGWQRFQHGFCSRCGAWQGCLGLEPTPELYIDHMVQVFREIRRVLRDDGTLWLNIGDCYSTHAHGNDDTEDPRWPGGRDRGADSPNRVPIEGVKHKDMLGMPWMLAFALRADGWYLRQECIWYKTNAMPESVDDRPVKAHEQMFLLTKRSRYFYDSEATRENVTGNAHSRGAGLTPKSRQVGRGSRLLTDRDQRHISNPGVKQNESFAIGTRHMVTHRLKRSVWPIATAPFGNEMCMECDTIYLSDDYYDLPRTEEEPKRAICRCGSSEGWLGHFATFPVKLIEPCILAGTSEKGCCMICRAPWERVVEKIKHEYKEKDAMGKEPLLGAHVTLGHDGHGKRYEAVYHVETRTVGWKPTCSCPGVEYAAPVPCTVFDPFTGAGTVGVATVNLQRAFQGTELNPHYIKLAEHRIDRETRQQSFAWHA
jgi:DNA modification methylase